MMMNRTSALKIGTAFVVLTLGLGTWIVRLRSENAALIARLEGEPATRSDHAPDADEPGRQMQLQRETRRLDRLRHALGEVNGASGDAPPDADANIRRLNHEIATTEAELISPYGDAAADGPRNEEYRRQQLHAQGNRQAEVLNRRRDLDERLAEVRAGEPTDASNAEVERLNRAKAELDEELTTIGAGMRPPGDAGSDEQTQRRAERVDLDRQVSDLRADLLYWSEQKSGAGPAGRQTRVQTLQKQIQEQEATLRALAQRRDERTER